MLGLLVIDTVGFTAQVCELFKQIDTDGDNTVSWEEFTNYIVEMGFGENRLGRADELRTIEEYTPQPPDSNSFAQGIGQVMLFDSHGLRRIAVIEPNSDCLKLFMEPGHCALGVF